MTPVCLQLTMLLLSVVVGLLSTEVSAVLHGATPEKLKEMFSLYEIVTPRLVSGAGHFLSHDLRGIPTPESPRRRRRSAEDNDDDVETVIVALGGPNSLIRSYNRSIDVRNDMFYPDRNESGFAKSLRYPARSASFESPTLGTLPPHGHDNPPPPPPPEMLHFNVSAFGAELQLSVQWKQHLIAPDAKSVVFASDGTKVETDISSACMLFGKVNHRPDSTVAISNCDGLAGLIKTDEGEIFIEPLETPEEPGKPQRHVVYKRSAPLNSAFSGKRMEREKRSHSDADASYGSLGNSLASIMPNPLTGKTEGRTREKRHTRKNAYNMEIVLTADHELVSFHGGDHVQNYLLTLINIVDEIYHDDSLGLHINIILTRIYQLDALQSRKLIRSNQAKTSLRNVCKWADDIFTEDPPEHNRRPDSSIFLTRRSFGPAGFAHVSGMCDRLRSCSLNFEDGFSTSFVVAHELGHVLGMEHDGEGNRCIDETVMGSIMAPIVQAAFHRYHWSRCSQQEIISNIGRFDCLIDDPHTKNWGPTPIYPGVTYSVDDQCRFNFGQGHRLCPAFSNLDKCKTLWCSHVDNPMFCLTKSGPPADGTACGDNMWCFKGHCLRRDTRQSVDGNWGPWSTYGDCSRTCGTGVMYRTRLCNRPPAANGGRDCTGQNMEPDLCNRRPCPSGRDFRAEQCMNSNGVSIKRERHKWQPYEHPKLFLKCELFCVSRKRHLVASMGDIVEDGTFCSYEDPHGICIRGECVNVGCDKMIGSPLREDACGVCNGDGSQCRNVTGELTKTTKRKINQYMKVYKIPRGARHIQIREIPSSDNANILALKSREGRRYFLNQRSRVISGDSLPYRTVSVGTVWTYDSENGVENITAYGPTNSDVNLMILVRSRQVRVDVRYNYVLHQRDVPRPRDVYNFAVRRWTPCSVTCGQGQRTPRFGCRSKRMGKWVTKRKCRGSPPKNWGKACNPGECPASISWLVSEWGSCSRTCGFPGVHHRSVTCRRTSSGELLDNALCSGQAMPVSQRRCMPPPCPAVWRKGNWSRCSATCGEGIQRRQVICRGRGTTYATPTCLETRPLDVKTCQLADCERRRYRPTSGSSSRPRDKSKKESECTTDQSIFCKLKAISSYCEIKGYRSLCCRSCRKHRRQYGEAPGSVPAVRHRLSDAVSRYFNNDSLYGNNQSALNNLNLTRLTTVHGEVFLHPEVVPDPSAHPGEEEEDDEEANREFRDLDVDREAALDDYEDDEDEEDHDPNANSGVREVIQTLSPQVNRTRSTPQSLLDADTSGRGENSGAARRRRRSVRSVFREWGKCGSELGCGVGKRRAIYGCWSESRSAWVTSSACRHPVTSSSRCVVPCYLRLPHKSTRRREFPSYHSSVCREFKRGFPGARTHPARCNYRQPGLDWDAGLSRPRDHFSMGT